MILGFSKTQFYIGAILLLVCYVLGLNIDLMEVDAAQYGSISMEMLKRGDFLQVFHKGYDYLDKPPLLFWTSAISFWVFGYSNIAFKLFSLLATILGAVSVFKFAKLYYNEKIVEIATIIYLTNVAVMLINNDVRTDTLLMGSCAFAVWMMGAFLKTQQIKYVFGIGIGTGLAMLAKGPIGLMVPLSALFIHILMQREWRKLLDIKWLIPVAVTAILLFPMCWGLYHQFDLHPEKVVNGEHGVSGLYFYFWEQSFGRITGESTWKDDTTVFYFLHTFLWAFIPWTLCFLAALWGLIRSTFSREKTFLQENFVIAAIIVPFVVLSFSHYKLPHYIFIVLPFTSILTAIYLEKASARIIKGLYFGSILILVLAVVLWLLFLLFVFIESSAIHWFIFLILTTLSFFWSFNQSLNLRKLIGLNVLTFIMIAFLMNGFFYPRLLQYQSSSEIGKFYCAQGLPESDLYSLNIHGHALDFYSRAQSNTIQVADIAEMLNDKNECWIYTNQQGVDQIEKAGYRPTVLQEVVSFKVTKLSIKFLNPKTREKVLSSVFLLHVEK